MQAYNLEWVLKIWIFIDFFGGGVGNDRIQLKLWVKQQKRHLCHVKSQVLYIFNIILHKLYLCTVYTVKTKAFLKRIVNGKIQTIVVFFYLSLTNKFYLYLILWLMGLSDCYQKLYTHQLSFFPLCLGKVTKNI